jgi:hypothetical protein
MACYNLDLDQFLPLASETIGYDFSSLVPTCRLRHHRPMLMTTTSSLRRNSTWSSWQTNPSPGTHPRKAHRCNSRPCPPLRLCEKTEGAPATRALPLTPPRPARPARPLSCAGKSRTEQPNKPIANARKTSSAASRTRSNASSRPPSASKSTMQDCRAPYSASGPKTITYSRPRHPRLPPPTCPTRRRLHARRRQHGRLMQISPPLLGKSSMRSGECWLSNLGS